MIGAWSFILEATFVVVPPIFLAASLWNLARKRQYTSVAIVALLLAVFIGYMPARFARQVDNHRRLESLDTNVVGIRIGTREVDVDRAEPVLAALRGARWFSVGNGGLIGEAVPLRIDMRDGTVLDAQVARYRRDGGAIVSFFSASNRGAQDGYAYVGGLPAVLGAHGVELPRSDHAFRPIVDPSAAHQ